MEKDEREEGERSKEKPWRLQSKREVEA